jgi:hypothetical protein
LPKIIDQEDYKRLVDSPDYIEQYIGEEDTIPFPYGSYSVSIGESLRHGYGLFATADFRIGDVVAPAKVGGMWTPAGRYVNHSKRPNAQAVWSDGDVNLIAKKSIKGSHGGILGDEITVDYREIFSSNLESFYFFSEGQEVTV